MSGAAVVHRRGLKPSKTGARILFTGGLVLTGWILGAVLSTPASAEEQTPTTTPETSVVQPPKETGAGKSTTPKESTSDSGEAEATKPSEPAETKTAEPAPTRSEEPEAAVEEKAVSSASSVEKTNISPEPAKTSTKNAKPQASDGLLGGLIGGVLDVVTNTVGGVLETVNGVVGGIGEKVITPILTPGLCNPGKPQILPGVGDVLDPAFGGGSGDSAGGSVSIAVPAKTVAPSQPAPKATDPRPFVPAEAPAPATAIQNYRVSLPRVQLETRTAPAAPAESDTHAPHASPDGGGSGGGGGGLPNTPVAPLAPTTSAQPGHDNSGGGRGPLAVLDSGMPATQLKLIGAGCDHEGERTGREAALPATSPD
ncbi:hypothetical protein [Amycolatopsis sp. NPDC051071]|uniref:hypothetical protein n=1 Tax=Amycolatopsis sp. NPDC051071 TaxID=3154637 RepID=UPI0034252F02